MPTTAYPIAAQWSGRNLAHDGFAATAEEARARYVEGMDAADAAEVPLPRLVMIECSHLGRAGGREPATGWDAELAAGYASVQDCGAWRKVCVETWEF